MKKYCVITKSPLSTWKWTSNKHAYVLVKGKWHDCGARGTPLFECLTRLDQRHKIKCIAALKAGAK